MRKLTLDSLLVESFHTTPASVPARGTVNAHAAATTPQPTPPTLFPTYTPEECGETRYFDCSLACPSIAPCGPTEYDCVG